MANPDKYIIDGFCTRLNGVEVSGNIIPCYPNNIPGPVLPMYYILVSMPGKTTGIKTKCGHQWEVGVLVDIVTRFDAAGNPNSRFLVNDIEESVYNALADFAIADQFSFEWESSTGADMTTDTEKVFRQLVRYNVVINN